MAELFQWLLLIFMIVVALKKFFGTSVQIVNLKKMFAKLPGTGKTTKFMTMKLILIGSLLLMGAILFYRDYPFLAVLVFIAAVASFIIKDSRTVLVLIVLAWLSFVFFMGGVTFQALWDAISFPVEWSRTFGRGY